MLAFKMKKPTQQMGLERMLSSKVDTERWGPQGVELIKKCDAMRERVREASRSFSEKGADECREVMGRYQAVVFQTAFVCQGVNLKALQLGFKWADAFEADEQTVVHDWTFERASVLFNLAASISFLATHCDRQTPDGLKQACGLYQQAAGALSAVQAIVKDAGWSASADLSSDTLHALESLMLAQAQKCFFEKAEIDGMSTKVCLPSLLNRPWCHVAWPPHRLGATWHSLRTHRRWRAVAGAGDAHRRVCSPLRRGGSPCRERQAALPADLGHELRLARRRPVEPIPLRRPTALPPGKTRRGAPSPQICSCHVLLSPSLTFSHLL